MSEPIVRETRLTGCRSGYLKEQAVQPVDWYPWEEDAFLRAQLEIKPIFLSVGNFGCKLSELMSEESFEDEQVASFLNENFVCIKVDGQQRPDVSAVFSEALRLINGTLASGPLTVFLTPRGKPFAGGTYFPRRSQFSTPSFVEVCSAAMEMFNSDSEEMNRRAELIGEIFNKVEDENCLRGLEIQLNDSGLVPEKVCQFLSKSVNQLEERFDTSVDRVHGGFGGAPKQLQANWIAALLHSGDRRKSAAALLTLDKIRCGGVSDPVDGGVFYSCSDARWQVPEFKKRLSDNLLLMNLFSSGSELLSVSNPEKSLAFRSSVDEIFQYLENNLRCPQTGFYFESEFIDQEIEDICFYAFSFDEILHLFSGRPDLSDFAIAYFGVRKKGHLQGLNILSKPQSLEAFCCERNLSLNSASQYLAECRAMLKELRGKRNRARRNETILLSLNSFAVTCLLQASQIISDDVVRTRALDLFEKIWKVFVEQNGGTPAHMICDGVAEGQAFADDLACLLQASVEAFCLTGKQEYSHRAGLIVKWIHSSCVDPGRGALYFAPLSSRLFARPLKLTDDELPSPPSSVFESCRKFLAHSAAIGSLGDLSASEVKMWEALELVSLSTFARMAKTSPHGCAAGLMAVRSALGSSVELSS